MTWEPTYSIVAFAKNLLGHTFDEIFLNSEILLHPVTKHQLSYTASGYILQIVDETYLRAFPLTSDQFHLFHIVLGTYASVASSNPLIWVLDEIRSFGWHAVPTEEYFASFVERLDNLDLSKKYVIQILVLMVMMYRKVSYAQKYIDQYMGKILTYPKFSMATKLMITNYRCVNSYHSRTIRKGGFFSKDSDEYIFVKSREKKTLIPLIGNAQADMMNAKRDGNLDLLLSYIDDPKYKEYHDSMIRYLVVRHPFTYRHLLGKFSTKDYTYHYLAFCVISGEIAELLKGKKPVPPSLIQRSVDIFAKIEHFGFNGIEEPNILLMACYNFDKIGEWQKAFITINRIVATCSILNNKPLHFSYIKFKLDILNARYPQNLVEYGHQCLQSSHLTPDHKQLIHVYLTIGYLFCEDNDRAIESYSKCETYSGLTLEWKRNFLNCLHSRSKHRSRKRPINPSEHKLLDKVRRLR